MNEGIEIKALHRKLWHPGVGSISASEAAFLSTLITQHKPLSFVEIGTASGLSSVIIATALKRNGFGELT